MYNVHQMNTENIKYPYLPEGKGIIFAPGDNQFMLEAKEMARLHSTDYLQRTGAVVVKDGQIIGRGANHSVLGKFESYNKLHQKGMCVRKFFNVKSGHGYWMCPGCVTNKNHAEASAVRDALKNGFDANGADLYLWGHWWACKPCWDAMIKGGIKNVYLLENAWELFRRESDKNILGRQFS